jgi:hypothetical protein
MTEEIPYCHCCGNRHADIGVLCEPCHDYTTRLHATIARLESLLREAREELTVYTRYTKDANGEMRADHSYICPAKRIDELLTPKEGARE